MDPNSGAAAAAGGGRKRPRTEGAAAGGAVSPTSTVDLLAEKIERMGRDDPRNPLIELTTSLRDVLKEIKELKAKNEGLEARQVRMQPGQSDWNALQGAIDTNTASLQTLRQQEEKRRADIKDLEQQAHSGGGAGAAAAGAIAPGLEPRSAALSLQPMGITPHIQAMWDEEKKNYHVEVKHLRAAGLAGAMDPDAMLLFMREEAIRMYDALENFASRGLLVAGPPGTGKSSMAWLWACHKAATKSVLWIHFGRNGAVSLVRMAPDAWKSGTLDKRDGCWPLMREFVGNTIVLDGITEELKKEGLLAPAIIWCQKQRGRKMIVVSSMQLRLGGEDYAQADLKKHRVASWELSEYRAACDSQAFVRQVRDFLPPFSDAANADDTLEDSLADKYHVAGGSVRWMFGKDVPSALEDANDWIKKADDVGKILGGLSGSESTAAVSHLLRQPSGSDCLLVSEYVARCLAEKYELEFVVKARQYSLNNPSFQGWVYEMAFLAHLRLQMGRRDGEMTLSSRTPSAGAQHSMDAWAVRAVRWFDVAESGPRSGDFTLYHRLEEKREMKRENIAVGTWLIPRCFNQGGYDAAQICPGAVQHQISLRVVQLTVSGEGRKRQGRHGLKLKYVDHLRAALVKLGFELSSIEIVMVIPPTVKNFAVGTVVGGRLLDPLFSGRKEDVHVLVWDDRQAYATVHVAQPAGRKT